MKRTIVFLIVVSLLFTVIPVNSYCTNIIKNGDFSILINEETKTAELYAYKGKGSNVTVPDNIDGYTVSKIHTWAFLSNDKIIEVYLPDTISEIGYEAFKNCGRLESVILPAGIKIIGSGAFEGCKSLKEIYVPEGCELYSSVFQDCKNLEKAEIYGVARSTGHLFCGCRSLVYVYMSEGVECLQASCFDGCINLSEIYLPDTIKRIEKNSLFDTAYYKNRSNWENDVLYVGANLFACLQADNKSVLDIKEGTVCIADRAAENSFYSEINMPESLDYIGEYAFSASSELKKVSFPSTMKKIGRGAFENCRSLETAILPEGIETVSYGLFYTCSSLSYVYVPEGVTVIEDKAFYSVQRGLTIELPSTLQSIGDYAVNYTIDYNTNNYVNTVVYSGTWQEWKNVNVGAVNFLDHNMVYKSFVLGDVSGNGALNSEDSIILKRYIAGTLTAFDIFIEAADINDDGKINSIDGFLLKRSISG